MVALLRILIIPILSILTYLVGRVRNPELWSKIGQWAAEHPMEIFTWALNIWFISWILKGGWRYWYAVRQSKKLVKLKILLPRSDSKIDQEKRTEKDFKEKIAVMEQLYRALWEVKSLNIWQAIHFWFWRYLTISMEMYVEENLISFYVVTEPRLVSIVEKQITSFYADAEIAPVEDTPDIRPEGYKMVAYNMQYQKSYMYPIRFYEQMQDDPLNSIVNVMSKLNESDRAAIQIVMTPAHTKKWNRKAKKTASTLFKGKKKGWFTDIPFLKYFGVVFNWAAFGEDADLSTNAPGASSGDSFVRMIQPEEELYKRMGEKAGMSFYETSIRIAASSPSWQRSLEITNNIQVAFNSFKDLYGNYLETKRLYFQFMPLKWNAKIMENLWHKRINGFHHKRTMMVEKELAGLYHFPDSRYNKVPSIQWLTYKVLPPPPDTPQEGILLGNNVHRGVTTPIRFLGKDRTRHHYIIGKSGAGKSALLSYMARQDIGNGDGVCMVDPHGDLIEDALAHSPKERAKDIVVFDPADNTRPMGVNLLEAKTPEEKDRASLDAM